MNKNWSATIFLRIPPELMELIDNSSSTTYSTGVELHLYGSGDEAIAEISKLLKQVEFEVNDPHMWVSIAENTGFGST